MRPGYLPAGKLPPALLRRLLSAYTHTDPRLVVPPGLGEDAAVIDFGDRYLVAKTDPITFATDAIGWYAVHVNANDIAAMGATPRFFLATIIVPQEVATEAVIEEIFAGIHAAADDLGVTVCGGHTEITHGIDRPIVVGQMLGELAPDQLVRSADLQPGDELILTKGLAIEATAIIARERGIDLADRGFDRVFLERCAGFLTTPGISVVRDAAIATATGGVRAMHDPTEGGLATALYELAEAADVGIWIDAQTLHLAPESAQLCTAFALDPLGVISSGALLIGCDRTFSGDIIDALEEAGIRAARIGSARPATDGLKIIDEGDERVLPTFPVDEITRIFEQEDD
jgi:hydrogenase expression/formation protein HypE